MLQNNDPARVCVIGGGIAGLSAAVFLASKGIKAALFEASPKPGGRAYSFLESKSGDYIDNGQHLLASWYDAAFEFLGIIGSLKMVKVQKKLEVRFADTAGKKFMLKCPRLMPPFEIISGIMMYDALRLSDKAGILKFFYGVFFKKFNDDELKRMNAEELFDKTGQSERLINNFWKPLIIAVFNAEPADTSAYLFLRVVKRGFLRKNGSKLAVPAADLNSVYVEPSISYLKTKGSEVFTSSTVRNVNFGDDNAVSITLDDGNELKFAHYISAVPFFAFKKLVGEDVYRDEFSLIDNLSPSPIVNIHHWFDNGTGIMDDDFTGVLGSPIHWVFRVSNDHVCIVISSAREASVMAKEELIEMSKAELLKCIPAFRNARFRNSLVVKEMRATFIPDRRSLEGRPKQATRFKNFFICGDWTDTGYPATLESAVLSSRICANEILSIENKVLNKAILN